MRVTSENITELKANEIFVFGSNLAGIHGGGAAYLAHKKFGAVMGFGVGKHGQSYAIPTKDENINTLPIISIKPFVNKFIEYASREGSIYFVTQIGCGLAGYTSKDIAPLFRQAINIENIHLPESFWTILNQE